MERRRLEAVAAVSVCSQQKITKKTKIPIGLD